VSQVDFNRKGALIPVQYIKTEAIAAGDTTVSVGPRRGSFEFVLLSAVETYMLSSIPNTGTLTPE
jgi:hypothetical protein